MAIQKEELFWVFPTVLPSHSFHVCRASLKMLDSGFLPSITDRVCLARTYECFLTMKYPEGLKSWDIWQGFSFKSSIKKKCFSLLILTCLLKGHAMESQQPSCGHRTKANRSVEKLKENIVTFIIELLLALSVSRRCYMFISLLPHCSLWLIMSWAGRIKEGFLKKVSLELTQERQACIVHRRCDARGSEWAGRRAHAVSQNSK